MQKAFELTLKLGSIPVFCLPHIQQNILEKVNQCKKFKDYVDKISNAEEGVKVSKIQILGVEMFGNNVGFVNLRAITTRDGYGLPGYVFLRGPAVAILMFVNGKILLVEQYRVPVQQTLLEAPAGMLDESGDFIGTAALQIEEETSIKIKREELHPLGSIYPSPGGSDQQILMFYCDIKLSAEQLKVIEEKIHGKQGEKERIKVKLFQYDPQVILKTKDAKLITLVYAYEHRAQQKL